MTAQWSYLDLDLAIDRVSGTTTQDSRYVARVLSSPSGEASADFAFPLSPAELELFRLTVGPPRVTSRRVAPVAPTAYSAKEYGRRLHDALFSADVAIRFTTSLQKAVDEGKGLRLRLRLSGAPALDAVPWEYLFADMLGRFLALSAETPIVRYFDTPTSARTLKITAPLKVLVMVSSPVDAPGLEVDKEVRLLEANTRDLVEAGLIELTIEEDATVDNLQRHLSYGEFHVFHFIGHGAFDDAVAEGVLLFEDPADHTAHRVKGSYVGTLLHDARQMQLAVINACEGARTSGQDTWSGVGQSLVRQGLPAVVAMQAEISDRAALAFSHEFYYALSRGFPVDAAVAEARKKIGATGDYEWGTPVLLQSATEQPFELVTEAAEPSRETMDQLHYDGLIEAAERAVAAGSAAVAAPILEQLMRDRPDDRAVLDLAGRLPPADAGAPRVSSATPQPTVQEQPHPTVQEQPKPTVQEQPPSGGPGGQPLGSTQPSDTGPVLPRLEPGPDDDGRKAGGWTKVVAAGASVVAVAALAAALWPGGDDPTPSGEVTPTTTQSGALPTDTGSDGTRTASPPTATVQSRTPTVVTAPFTRTDKVIDGQVDDWVADPTVRSTAQVAPRRNAPTDISADWWLSWNQNKLFVYTVVTDPVITPVPSDLPQAWRGDSVSFEFGPDVRNLSRTAALRAEDVHMILGVADLNGTVVPVRNNSDGKVIRPGGELRDVEALWWKVDNGYAIEAAIPWSALKVAPPSPGATFGMNLNVSDAVPDGAKKGSLQVMVSSNPARDQPRPGLWDRVELAPPGTAAQ